MINKTYSIRYEVALKRETKKKLEALSKELKISKRKVLEQIIDEAFHAYLPIEKIVPDKELKEMIRIAKTPWLDD